MLLRVRGHHFSGSIKDSDTEKVEIRLTIFLKLLADLLQILARGFLPHHLTQRYNFVI